MQQIGQIGRNKVLSAPLGIYFKSSDYAADYDYIVQSILWSSIPAKKLFIIVTGTSNQGVVTCIGCKIADPQGSYIALQNAAGVIKYHSKSASGSWTSKDL